MIMMEYESGVDTGLRIPNLCGKEGYSLNKHHFGAECTIDSLIHSYNLWVNIIVINHSEAV